MNASPQSVGYTTLGKPPMWAFSPLDKELLYVE